MHSSLSCNASTSTQHQPPGMTTTHSLNPYLVEVRRCVANLKARSDHDPHEFDRLVSCAMRDALTRDRERDGGVTHTTERRGSAIITTRKLEEIAQPAPTTAIHPGRDQITGSDGKDSKVPVEAAGLRHGSFRGRMGIRIGAAEPANSVRLIPTFEAVEIHDEQVLLDSLFHFLGARAYQAMWTVPNTLCHVLWGVVLGPFGAAFTPFAIISYTNTTNIFFADTTNRTVTNVTAHTQSGHAPWGPAWTTATLTLDVMASVCVIWIGIFTVMVCTGPTILRLIWRSGKPRLISTFGTTLAYSVAAATLMPHPVHVLNLIARISFVNFCLFYDAVAVFARQRHRNSDMKKKWSRKGGKKSFRSLRFVISSASMLACDYFRHLTIVFVSKDVDVLDLGLVNPITQKRLGITNRQIADTMYFAHMIFVLQVLLQVVQGNQFTRTALLKSEFLLEKVERVNE